MTQENIDDSPALARTGRPTICLELGGEDGITALDILRTLVKPLMDSINGKSDMPPKPCDVFQFTGVGSGRLLAAMFKNLEMSADAAIVFFEKPERIKSGEESESLITTYLTKRIKCEIRKELFAYEGLVEGEEGWPDLDLDSWVARIEAHAGFNTSEIAARMRDEMAEDYWPTERKDGDDESSNPDLAGLMAAIAEWVIMKMDGDDVGSINSSTDTERDDSADDDGSTLAKYLGR